MKHRMATRAETDGRPWAVVLAGGCGTRLSGLTCDASGATVPKQFCSLDGRQTLLERTLDRARTVVAFERVTTIVTASHRPFWEPLLKDLPSSNVVVQPQNRGTGIGILLPALRIAARDPKARIIILPSDHHVADEKVLAQAMRSALRDIRANEIGVALLGIMADEADESLGYIVTRASSHPRLHAVHRFIEKPEVEEARRLVNEGALWNSFIIACRVESLIAMLLHACPDAVLALQAVDLRDQDRLLHVYRTLPAVDFSRQVVPGQEHRIAVRAVGSCGWSDLGTPDRLAKTLSRQPRLQTVDATMPHDTPPMDRINLAQRLAQFHPTLPGDTLNVSQRFAPAN